MFSNLVFNYNTAVTASTNIGETAVVAYLDCIHARTGFYYVYCIHKEYSPTRRLTIVSYISI